MEDIVIRRNRMAIGALGSMAVALALAGCGAQGTPGSVPSPAANGGAQTADGGQTPPLEVPLPGADGSAGTDPAAPAPPPAADPAGGGGAPTDSSVTLIAKTIPKMGDVITDARGFVLYRFDKDSANPPKSNCDNAKCDATWPAVIAQGTPVLQGIDPSIVGTVVRSDGKQQVTINGWPVYRYSKDPAPGKWKGQGVGNTWWVIAPDGKRNLTCVPKGAIKPSGDAGAGDSSGSSSSSGSSDTGGSYSY
jgi:predicted lipoprotein with Yx(FWY)xxD motif